ncbi:hypothetical protein AgCh_023232 [Apium graveolens]
MDSSCSELPKTPQMLPPAPGTFVDSEALIQGGVCRKPDGETSGERSRKKSGSRHTNCPFELVGKKDDGVWILMVKSGLHYHEPLKDIKEHPSASLYREGMKRLKTLSHKKPTEGNLQYSTSTDELSWKRRYLLRVPNFIGGKFVESQSSTSIDVINPATQKVVSQVPVITYEEFKAAVFAAKRASLSWRNTPLTARQRVMFRF